VLPSVLEIFVVWHPDDRAGPRVAQALLDRFHGTAFTGLIGGAVEVYVRSAGWQGIGAPPRPIALPGGPPVDGVAAARYVAVVPVVGLALARAVERDDGWYRYLVELLVDSDRVKIVPVQASQRRDEGRIHRLLCDYMYAVLPEQTTLGDAGMRPEEDWLRDVVQTLTQFVTGSQDRLRVFISHTRKTSDDRARVRELTELVRDVIIHTRLDHFFDASNLQIGGRWVDDLRANAARGALLALRTDLYASRAWCQEEVQVAKEHGVPLVVVDALEGMEERGSFLMDHVPRVPVRRSRGGWSRSDVMRGLSLLVDETLKRALWRRQEQLGAGLQVAWWAPHAPEPLTFASWLLSQPSERLRGSDPLRVLHPDPPLGRPERLVLEQVLRLRDADGKLDVMTPRQLAARGGGGND
jgi:hypothetical protein